LEIVENKYLQRDIFEKITAGRRKGFTLQMAPMIDVIFLLLLFFLVAARWKPQEDYLPFRLPTAGAQSRGIGRPEPLIIHILPTLTGCKVRIGQVTVPLDNAQIEADLVVLADELKNCLIAQKRFAEDPIEVICDPKLKWDHLAKIYNLFCAAGLTDITFPITE